MYTCLATGACGVLVHPAGPPNTDASSFWFLKETVHVWLAIDETNSMSGNQHGQPRPRDIEHATRRSLLPHRWSYDARRHVRG
eukprot:5388073-Pyramimonas_sp.AAC.2